MDFRVPNSDSSSLAKTGLYNLAVRANGFLGCSVGVLFAAALFAFSSSFLRGDFARTLEIPLFLTVFGLGISFIFYTVYRLGKWIQVHLLELWNRTSPPHSSTSPGRTTPYEIIHNTLLPDRVTACSECPDDLRTLFVASYTYFIIGFLLSMLLFIAFLMLDEAGWTTSIENSIPEKDGQPTISDGVSTAVALISVLLGSVLGVLIIGLFTLSSSKYEVIVFTVLFVIPGALFLPFIKNCVRMIQKIHVSVLPEAGPSTLNIVVLYVLNSLYLSIIVLAINRV